jgi:bromodomain-containing factor 1
MEKVPKPMDFGTVTANLLEGKYQSCDDFCNDCRLVVSNCTEYYRGREDGKMYIEQASRLNEVLSQQIEQLSRYVRSSRGLADQARANAPVVLLQPPVSVLLSTLEELRALKYTDKATKITEPAMGPFERPVSLAAFPDYLQYVDTPMDLQSIERKVKSLVYATPEDFEYDVNLVFKNCESYNARRNGDHLVAMAKFGARQFRRMFYANVRAFEDPSSVIMSPSAPEASAAQSGGGGGGGPSKKIKLDLSGASS